jgi:hypothetical protein
MASASAAERSQADESLRHKRGQQVVLTFSGQVRSAREGACAGLAVMAMCCMAGA